MNHRERIIAAAERRKTDQVAKGELGIAKELIRQITGRKEITLADHIAARNYLHMDLINWWGAGTDREVIKDQVGELEYRDAWGNIWRQTASTSEITVPALSSLEQLRGYEYPEISSYSEKMADIEYFARQSGLFVFAQMEGVFTPMSWLFGFNDFMIYTCTDEQEIARLAMDLGRYFANLSRYLLDRGAHGIIIGDDLAFNSGTFIAPAVLRQLFFPALKEEVRLIRQYKDVPIFFHTDGNINLILDDIVDCGFDGIHSLQPSAGMDIGQVKAGYGDKLCLMGNIDISNVLPFGTCEEVRSVVRETIRAANGNGGFILSTCNILTRDIPLDNAVAMYDEAEKISRQE